MMGVPSTCQSPEFAAAFRDFLLERIEWEMAATLRVIAAVPEDKKDYRPHPVSRSAWEIAWHLAVSDVWFMNAVASHDFAFTEQSAPVHSIAELGPWYEQGFKQAVARIRALTPAELAQPVDFFGILNFPASLYLLLAHDHVVHHRGQLSAYLRAMGAKVPDIYGGSADEPFTGA